MAINLHMNQINDTPIYFNTVTVMVNQIVPDMPNHCKNCVCLIIKQYLHRKRCFKQLPNVQEATQLIHLTKNIEKIIATRNNKLSKHNKKWYGP